ncbi:MAG: Fur family transcriptional regulator [Hyphomicrobiaceae bacterium]
MKPASPAPTFPTPGHDHGPCLAEVIERAQAAFDTTGLRLTELRRRVLEEVAGSHKAIGAYDVLERLSARGGRRLAPISVYRALDTLVAAGVVHRLESRNAFFACHAAHAANRRQIVLACDTCGSVAEVSGARVFEGITAAADAVGFRTQQALVEVSGLCKACDGARPDGARS